MVVAFMFTPGDPESILYTVRILVSVCGFVVLCLGVMLYLYVHIRDRAEAVARSGEGAAGLERGGKP